MVLIACNALLLWRYGRRRLYGSDPQSLSTFLAILFTSGLDMGLIILPLTEFPLYASEADYAFANPLAIEFGFWGFYIWSFYFVSCFYFCALEPHLRFFERPLVRVVHNAVIVSTAAFTVYLFRINIGWYLPDVSPLLLDLMTVGLILVAVTSSSELRFIKWLSFGSTAAFAFLVFWMWTLAAGGWTAPLGHTLLLYDYFSQLHRFLLPFNEHHSFYLLWWFSWAAMIGQFVSRFVGGLRCSQLFLAMLLVPSIPLALWFAVLYDYFLHATDLGYELRSALLGLAVLFTLNSVDSLLRLFSENIGFDVARLGRGRYLLAYSVLVWLLVCGYQYTALGIHWVGFSVIGLFAALLLNAVKAPKAMDLEYRSSLRTYH